MRRGRAPLGLIAVLLLVALPVPGPDSSAAARGRRPPAAHLGPRLQRLVDGLESGARPARALARDGSRAGGYAAPPDGLVTVILEPLRRGRARMIHRGHIAALRGRIEATSRSLMRVRVPYRRLRGLVGVAGLGRARLPLPMVALDTGTGGIVSESVDRVGAGDLQLLGTTGAGVGIAVIDLGFSNLTNTITAGELPANVITFDFTGLGLAGGSHGTAVAEQVADMAPGAQLHLLRIGDLVDLENAVQYVANNGIPIVNLSLAWVQASYYDDTGPVSDAINDSHDLDGVFWVVAAGNFAERHWRGAWFDADGDNLLEFITGDERMELSPGPTEICVFLNWDQYSVATTDLDLRVYDALGAVAAESIERQGGGPPRTPTESLCFDHSPSLRPYEVEVEHVSGSLAGLDISVFTFDHGLEHPVASSSMMDPAVAHGAFTTTAVDWQLWEDPPTAPDDLSSRGPTTDGRLKPDVTAPHRTSSLNQGVNGAVGTSYAAPVVAGAAALLLEEDPSRTNLELGAALRAMTQDVGYPGPDVEFGSGLLALELPPGLPDTDGDGEPDALDNCPYTPNPLQLDSGGMGTTAADGIGDACQCGDVTADGRIDSLDTMAVREDHAGIPGAGVLAPELCNVRGPADGGVADCRADDLVVLRRALLGLDPGAAQVCDPAIP